MPDDFTLVHTYQKRKEVSAGVFECTNQELVVKTQGDFDSLVSVKVKDGTIAL